LPAASQGAPYRQPRYRIVNLSLRQQPVRFSNFGDVRQRQIRSGY